MKTQTTLPAPIAQAVNALLATAGTNLTELTSQKSARAPGRLLRVKEAAERIGVSIPTLYRMIKRGQIKTIKVSEVCTRIPEKEIIQLSEGAR